MNGELRAGSLSATLVGAELQDVRWGSLDLASRILVTVRDADWGTVAPVVRDLTIERSADAFLVELDAVHDDGAIAFGWRGLIEGHADGTLTFGIEGAGERECVYRRIGLCVLHPWGPYVGSAFEAATPDGWVEGTFPKEIAPQMLRDGGYQPMIPAFSELRVHLRHDAGVAFVFEGELFELEDQRNWTDASFKTYPTPVALSEPRAMSIGERVVQRLAVEVDGPAPSATVVHDVTQLRVGEATGGLMPPIGTVDVVPGAAHIRVVVDASARDVRAVQAAATHGVPLELALSVDEYGSRVDELSSALLDVPLARILIHLASGATIQGDLVRSIRERLGRSVDGVPIVGGTRDSFSELNRHPPDGVAVDAIACSIRPTVHATDQRSIMETLEIQPQVLRRARTLADGLPIVISPVTLDEHVGTPFADAWTIGSVVALTDAGVASLTYQTAAPALAFVMELRGAELLEVTVSRPDRVAALAAGTTVVIANLTSVLQQIRVDGGPLDPLTPYEVRVASTG